METKNLPREKVIFIDNEFVTTKAERLGRCIRNIIYIAALSLVVFSIFLMINSTKVSYDAGAPVSDDPDFLLPNKPWIHTTKQTVMEQKIAELQGQVSFKSVKWNFADIVSNLHLKFKLEINSMNFSATVTQKTKILKQDWHTIIRFAHLKK